MGARKKMESKQLFQKLKQPEYLLLTSLATITASLFFGVCGYCGYLVDRSYFSEQAKVRGLMKKVSKYDDSYCEETEEINIKNDGKTYRFKYFKDRFPLYERQDVIVVDIIQDGNDKISIRDNRADGLSGYDKVYIDGSGYKYIELPKSTRKNINEVYNLFLDDALEYLPGYVQKLKNTYEERIKQEEEKREQEYQEYLNRVNKKLEELLR